LRIFKGTFKIAVDKSDNVLTVFMNDAFFKRYSVGTGAYNKTPVGRFTVTDKIAQPPWWRPDGKQIPFGDPENLLGTRWMAIRSPDDPFLTGYGIHGTWEPDTIGKQASAGCVRMLNSDVEELFTLIPVNTSVDIQD
jgi:lipoprotein-anchoring transpeptidase ErfK/SrfK